MRKIRSNVITDIKIIKTNLTDAIVIEFDDSGTKRIEIDKCPVYKNNIIYTDLITMLARNKNGRMDSISITEYCESGHFPYGGFSIGLWFAGRSYIDENGTRVDVPRHYEYIAEYRYNTKVDKQTKTFVHGIK